MQREWCQRRAGYSDAPLETAYDGFGRPARCRSPVFSPDLESRILKAAQTQGLLPNEPVETPLVPQSDEDHGLWSNRMAYLLSAGRLTQASLGHLAWDAIGGEIGSWVDPLFKGPAPLGDLAPLGNRYRDLALLGEGASAKVYKALDTLLQRNIALKVLKEEGAAILAEARAQAQVEHPNVCRIYEVGQGYLVMQLVEGPTLAQLAPNLDEPTKVRLVRDIALGIHAAHQRGLVHLDLKLNNVLVQLGEDGGYLPVVGDFGMVLDGSTRAEGTCPMGTPPYTSPEQLAGDASELDRRADVYALGVILYILLSGHIPFDVHDFETLLRAIARESPVHLRQRSTRIPVDLAQIVHRCLEKVPAARYATAQELAEDLERFLEKRPVKIMAGNWAYRLRLWSRRNHRLAWLGVVGLAILLATTGFQLHHTRFVSEQAEWDQHFQGILEEMRTFLELTHRLPAHDISPELDRARGFMEAIQRDMAHQGRAAQNPGLLALGQARLLLDAQDEQAPQLFQRAWDQGYHTESARTWLALTLLQAYRRTNQEVGRNLDRTEAEALRARVRQGYLSRIRIMLKGRGTPDQARLAHQADLVEAWSQPTVDYDRIIELTRTHCARFPEDVEGLLEEVHALSIKADHQCRTQGRHQPGWETEVEQLRDRARMRLNQAFRIAPSHPGVYGRWASLCLDEDAAPVPTTRERGPLLAEAERWIRMGLTVSPQDQSLKRMLGTFLVRQATEWRLAQRQDPGPLLVEAATILNAAWATGELSRRAEIMDEELATFSLLEGYGRSDAGLLNRITERLLELGPSAVAPAPPFRVSTWHLTHARTLMSHGNNPLPVLNLGLKCLGMASDELSQSLRISLHLEAAAYSVLLDQDPSLFLDAAEEQFRAYHPKNAIELGSIELNLCELRAQGSRSPEAWNALEESLYRQEIRQVNPLSAARIRLVLARHASEQGRDPVPLLLPARQVYQRYLDTGREPLRIAREGLAECCLLEAPRSRNPEALLMEGLHLIGAGIEVLPSLSMEEVRRGGRPLTKGPHIRWVADMGTGLRLRGELLLELAALKTGPWRSRAEEALVVFHRAARKNPNLARSLSPLQARAQILVGPAPSLSPESSSSNARP